MINYACYTFDGYDYFHHLDDFELSRMIVLNKSQHTRAIMNKHYFKGLPSILPCILYTNCSRMCLRKWIKYVLELIRCLQNTHARNSFT